MPSLNPGMQVWDDNQKADSEALCGIKVPRGAPSPVWLLQALGTEEVAEWCVHVCIPARMHIKRGIQNTGGTGGVFGWLGEEAKK